MDVRTIDRATLRAIEGLGLPHRTETGPYVVLSVYGDGVRVTPRWTARVYRNAKGGLKLVTTDYRTLERLLAGPAPAREKIIKVDDAGWGFPLGGVMIGAETGGRVETGLVDVRFFQGALFEEHAYLGEAARVTLALVETMGGRPQDTLVEICTGYVNSGSKDKLRDAGYEVRVTEITGTLQHELEARFKEYVVSLGYREYFDPKEARDPASAFNKVIRWICEDPRARMRLAKTGWKYFRQFKC
ncbi:MAG: hypothetical protein A4E28_01047 [Methanocella sp. PtaU1.Bin125]|nr:MAG: hypothetical protein A4E28_01047 [Methanocella sp. PtaU1.Bin125]